MRKIILFCLIPILGLAQENCCGIEKRCYDYSSVCGQACLIKATNLLNKVTELQNNLDNHYDDLNQFSIKHENSIQLKISSINAELKKTNNILKDNTEYLDINQSYYDVFNELWPKLENELITIIKNKKILKKLLKLDKSLEQKIIVIYNRPTNPKYNYLPIKEIIIIVINDAKKTALLKSSTNGKIDKYEKVVKKIIKLSLPQIEVGLEEVEKLTNAEVALDAVDNINDLKVDIADLEQEFSDELSSDNFPTR
jgi:hypothetical protein